jgi:hypothetical protein
MIILKTNKADAPHVFLRTHLKYCTWCASMPPGNGNACTHVGMMFMDRLVCILSQREC